MKRLFILLLSISLLQVTVYALPMGKRVEMTKLAILSFYKSYLSESMDVRQCDSLARSFLTPEMYVRLNRMNRLADADQLTRSQDTTPTALETLSCRHIKGDWYEVSWRFSPKDSLTHIPLKIKYVKTKPYICYLIPEWGGKNVEKNLLDAVQRCKVTIGSKGEIEMRQIAEYKQHIPDDELKQNPPLSFGDFLSKFRKWDKKEFGDSLFVCSQEANSSLSSSLLLELFPKNIICERCWPKDLCWTPCHYIETEHSFLCFMVIDCSFPKGQELPYSNYVIALFDKKRQFQKIVNVMHMNHDDGDKKIDGDVLNKICTNLTQ